MCRMGTHEMRVPLECAQSFTNGIAKQQVAEVRATCHLNPNAGAQPKSSDVKTRKRT